MTTVNMIAAIQSCLGSAMATYVGNKNRGGQNGKKGSRYEDLFMTFKAAEAAATQVDAPESEWPSLAGQSVGFVDDTVVSTTEKTNYYQLKNSNSVSWAAGDHPIATDFESQMVLAKHLGISGPSTNLVVPTYAQKLSLEGSIPDSIKGHSGVHSFPYCEGSFNRLVLENPDVRTILSKLARVEDPTMDELVGVFASLLMSCTEHMDGGSLDAIIAFANRTQPGLLRVFPADTDWSQKLTPDFVKVLANIPGLSYGVGRGYFAWSAFGTSGVFSSDCASPQFERFQQLIVREQPKTFEELESYLP
ncbi:MAG: hypothetical protein LBE58_18080 [Comamonas sp.]|jgi:hypothetical protein|nr:hypothetical protein [Comamonas sp.]